MDDFYRLFNFKILCIFEETKKQKDQKNFITKPTSLVFLKFFLEKNFEKRKKFVLYRALIFAQCHYKIDASKTGPKSKFLFAQTKNSFFLFRVEINKQK